MNHGVQTLKGSEPREIIGNGLEAVKDVLTEGVQMIDLCFRKNMLSFASIDNLSDFDPSKEEVGTLMRDSQMGHHETVWSIHSHS